ncbi:hypothetical protein ATX84_09320 [Oenococcus oeni]|uniref:hypothetical protein n=2 Tax=Oenococcus oeni TaxID=1247 RepID=UPI0008F800B7|nr:hypothetical protein [Oenococcus oeni]OIL04938.1 hypothetical protein ATW89_04090 [Oenococcus oeni]OIL09751.1 hypothetical protein ATW91_04280 [Oenococcus oeni]OIM49954.1 hypothetical protein ATX79_09965 [Oenococcus oeni]OIM58692.1 hypothetical protein ATX84_09320 [Oenococcus oeni]
MRENDGVNNTEIIMEILQRVTKVEEQTKGTRDYGPRIDSLENKVGEHESHFKFLYWGLSAICVFLFIGVIAPLLVDWLAKIGSLN